MEAPPTGAGQGPVDRLASYFLSKFQEAKKEDEIYSLQCTTQLKFEAIEKTLDEHARDFVAVHEDMRSFWDKAPSFFLHKFSAQLDSLGAGRTEKTELALARQEKRLDDETRNLAEQLAELSTKLAVGTANLNAKVDEITHKISEAASSTTDSTRRSENELRAKISRLEGLLEANKAEAELGRSKTRDMFQETTKQFQFKIDNLEQTLLQQSEHLTSQEETIRILREDVKKETEMRTNNERTYINIFRILTTNIRELTRIRAPLADETPQAPVSRAIPLTTTPLNSGNETGPNQASRPRSTSPRHPIARIPTTTAVGTKMPPGGSFSTLKRPPSISPSAASTLKRKKETLPSVIPKTDSRASRSDAESSPLPERKRITAGGKNPSLGQTKHPDAKHSVEMTTPVSTRPQSKRDSRGKHEGTTPDKTHLQRPEMDTSTNVITQGHLKSQRPPTTHAGPAQQQAPMPQTPLSRGAPSPRIRKRKLEQMSAEEKNDTEKGPEIVEKSKEDQTKATEAIAGHPAHAAQQRGDNATRAFAVHAKLFTNKYNAERPRSERLFIWRFLDEIPDARWAAYMQEQLLEAYPESVQPSLGKRAKHAINFDAGLTWRHVVHLIRAMRQKPVPAHLEER